LNDRPLRIAEGSRRTIDIEWRCHNILAAVEVGPAGPGDHVPIKIEVDDSMGTGPAVKLESFAKGNGRGRGDQRVRGRGDFRFWICRVETAATVDGQREVLQQH